ncbi:uncharacterized protein EI97DRAFT_84843 [Westerdykella ornata]|uniref:Uncharacterized protein n=1 Tax=Westerdykella ornata TaxID=318751 RepID=A0A6A6JFT3_WESOR|nr:uncharacterized protein EI97DRAFT_84843 [Westerdykella ornata]KAF2275013.1 hypothetical protein EI97DRAFT_84843 [Westerdykella ornata]
MDAKSVDMLDWRNSIPIPGAQPGKKKTAPLRKSLRSMAGKLTLHCIVHAALPTFPLSNLSLITLRHPTGGWLLDIPQHSYMILTASSSPKPAKHLGSFRIIAEGNYIARLEDDRPGYLTCAPVPDLRNSIGSPPRRRRASTPIYGVLNIPANMFGLHFAVHVAES